MSSNLRLGLGAVPTWGRVWAGVLLVHSVLWAAASIRRAHAQDTAAGTRTVVVLLPRDQAGREETESLTEFLISIIAARGSSTIVGKEEFEAALGRDDQGTLECIESDVCLARMGELLRADTVVAGFVSARGASRYRVELYRLTASTGHVDARIAREVEGFEPLLAALTSSVDELYVEHVVPGSLVVRTETEEATLRVDGREIAGDAPFRVDLLLPGSHDLALSAPGHRTVRRQVAIEGATTLMLDLALTPSPPSLRLEATTFVPWAVGGVLLAVGSGLGIASQAAFGGQTTMREAEGFYRARQAEAEVANVLFVSAGIALAFGTVLLVIDATDDPPEEVFEALGDGVIRW